MSFKTILVPLEGSESNASVLETALVAARIFGAHLEVLHVKADPREVFAFLSEPATAGSVELVMEAAERNANALAAKARGLFDAFCRKSGVAAEAPRPGGNAVSASWNEEVGLAGELVAARGRLADLVAVARPAEKDPAPVFLETALMETGRPILVAPPRAAKTLGTSVTIAWNDSAQAARAVAAAMPFLTRADKVTILTVKGPDEAAASPRDLAAHLARHGVKAATKTITAGSRHAGEALLAESQGLGADLLVMGGFGHSRVREIILGGVTQHVLAAARLPVLMMH
jgi:nucleotide-binding universal stress UspA family protein